MGTSPDPEAKISSAASAERAAGHDTRGVLLLSAADLGAVLDPGRCLAALEAAYAELHRSPRDRSQSVGFKADDGTFHVKAGLYPGTRDYFAAKINANFPANPDRFGAPTIQGLVVLSACDDGRPVAVMHSGELTAWRTAAATALAAKRGARAGAGALAMIGCGQQARYQAAAVLNVLPIETIAAYDRDAASAGRFRSWAEKTLGVAVTTTASVADALGGADVCVTCTTATRPVVTPGMVAQGCFIAAVGADNPDKNEIDPGVFAGARVLVDDLDQCAQSGDLAHAIRAGAIGLGDVAATLAELAAGVAPGRTGDNEIVIFDSTGTGIQDVAAAVAASAAAQARGIGTTWAPSR